MVREHRSITLADLPKVKESSKRHCYMAVCPNNCGDRTGHAEVDLRQNLFYCVRCGRGGRIYGDGIREERLGMPVHENTVPMGRELGDLIEENTPQWNYLKNERGFNDTLIRKLEPHRGPEPWRVYFPIYDLQGNQVLQTGRTIRDTSPKWWFPPGKPGAHEFLWGANRIEPGAEEIIVVEGIFDAVWDDRRVAIFGSNMSSFQVNILTRDLAPKKITIALDRDALDKARILATRIAMIWTAEIYIVELPRKKDPCDLGYDGSTTIEKSKELWI